MSVMSLSVEEVPGVRQPMITNSASLPRICFSFGAVTGASGFTVKVGRFLLGFQSPKYFSMILTASSGSKSPERQMATLFGT